MLQVTRADVLRMLLSLTLSVALWTVVTTSENPERVDWFVSQIPVETRGLPPDLVVKSAGEAPSVRVRISAPRENWSRLQESSFIAYMSVARSEPGLTQADVRVEVSDPQVHIIEVRPAQLSIRVELLRTVTVPVRVQIQGNVAFGYVHEKEQVAPTTVQVSGPASVVEEVDHANVNVRIEGERSSITVSRRPTPQNRLGGDLAGITGIEPQVVQVVIPVRQVASYKSVSVVADVRGQPAPGYMVAGIRTVPSSMTILGEPQRVEDITTISTQPFDISGATGDIERQVPLVRAPGVSLEMDVPVTVRLTIVPVPVTSTVRTAVVAENVAPGLVATVTPASVELLLAGPSPALQRVEDLRASVDAAGLGEGTHALQLSVVVPPDVTVQRITPSTATLTLAPPS
jgi:YbbR domain-containing protein